MGRRKLEISSENIKQIEALAGYGLTEAAIAHALGMNPRTFRRRKNGGEPVLKAEIESALQRGKSIAEGAVGKALYTRALAGDVQAIRWWEMTRAGRTEKRQLEVNELPTMQVYLDAADPPESDTD